MKGYNLLLKNHVDIISLLFPYTKIICFWINVFLSKISSVMGYGGCPQTMLVCSFLLALLCYINQQKMTNAKLSISKMHIHESFNYVI